ncbi:TOPRIM nucleotidyl transferase/hydrolase domain-containing protein [Ruania halotolerans]|uniref:TOPRIM nucleotidyl transferase/hydrolase domain-containing protein n=1 Tax=Ruania halotolerans TaxID=2897773 RepID=UPI001E4DEB82|nr:TOPRIM nucleotidyl transferase/hydrolase domain-containing protein [Ruania halotolerans]UFU06035.1 ATP-dependent endonuclease [Ruania halotolerans]
MRAVVLVEGRSDQAALLALAAGRGIDLRAAEVQVRPIGGATNIRRALAALRAGPHRDGVPHLELPAHPPGAPPARRTTLHREARLRRRELTIAGLCDAAEEGFYSRAVAAWEGVATLDRAAMEARGFFVCSQDLEDELIRALSVDGVLEVLERNGDLGAFQTFRHQPAQRDRPVAAQLHRFLGTRSGRKIAYAAELTRALGPEGAPRPLVGALEHALAPAPDTDVTGGR